MRVIGDAAVTGPPAERFRFNARSLAFTDRPFEGGGASLYVTLGQRVQYRNLRVIPVSAKRRGRSGTIKAGTVHDLAADSVLKTARRASASGEAGDTIAPTYDLTAHPEWASGTIAIDLRPYRDDVELDIDNDRIQRIGLDASHNSDDQVRGFAVLLAAEIRAGGIVRFRWRWVPAGDTTPVDSFIWQATAGPDSAGLVTVTGAGAGLYEADTPPLDDSSAWTWQLDATAGTATRTLLEGVQVTPDATGPPAPVQLVTSPR